MCWMSVPAPQRCLLEDMRVLLSHHVLALLQGRQPMHLLDVVFQMCPMARMVF